MRKALLTVNNPNDNGYGHEKIKEILENHFSTVIYYCMADEVGGKENTYHTHLFIMFSSPVRFSQLKNYFPTAHIDSVRGTPQETKDYVFKTGKWEESDKAPTNLRDTHFESGELPSQTPGKRNDLSDIYQLIKEGESTTDILEAYPQYFTKINMIDLARQRLLYEEKKNEIRPIFVVYIYGHTGTGKTRFVYARHEANTIFKVTDYSHPFDRYNTEEVLFLDEFRSSLPIGDLLQYLDIYPTILPARYSQKQACYNIVYIISNEPLDYQYNLLKHEKPETWKAFRRRIDVVINLDDYLKKHSTYEEAFIVLDIKLKQDQEIKKLLFDKKVSDSKKIIEQLRS